MNDFITSDGEWYGEPELSLPEEGTPGNTLDNEEYYQNTLDTLLKNRHRRPSYYLEDSEMGIQPDENQE